MDNLPTIVLQDALNLRDVTTKGSRLDIDTGFEDYFEGPEPCFQEDCRPPPASIIGEPVLNVQELIPQLKQVDKSGYVKKKVLIAGGGEQIDERFTVTFVFSGYFEGESEPFCFVSIRKPMTVDMNDNSLLPGLQTALCSMQPGEESVFLLSYEVMYGVRGSPQAKIKPKADCIHYIRVTKCCFTSELSQLTRSDPDNNIFNRVFKEVRMLFKSALKFNELCNYPAAIKLMSKATFMLQRCRLANEEEEKQQEKFLKKLYLNLAVLYNKSKLPLKACIQCNEYHRLENIWNNEKVLYQNAKALRMIGQYDAAEKRIRRALKIAPEQESLKEELKVITLQREAYQKTNSCLSKIINDPIDKVSENFKLEINKLIDQFVSDENSQRIYLPVMKPAEMAYLKKVAEKRGIISNAIKKQEFSLDKSNGNDECEDLIIFSDEEAES